MPQELITVSGRYIVTVLLLIAIIIVSIAEMVVMSQSESKPLREVRM